MIIKKKKYLYNNLYSFEKSGIFNKVFLILKLRKNNYKQIIIFDGKDRSIILSKFLNVDKIFLTYPQKKINLLTKIFFSKKYTTISDNQTMPLKYLYKSILDKIGVKIKFDQSNFEGEIVTMIQKAKGAFDGIIINAAGYTHTSVAILDALLAIKLPTIEVHITNIYNREEFRKKSLISKAAKGIICGFGVKGYIMALDSIKEIIN